MKNKLQKNKPTASQIILPVAGVIVGAAVMATVSNHKNQARAQVLLEQVKNKASSYMKTAKEASIESQQKMAKTLAVAKATDKKVTDIWKK